MRLPAHVHSLDGAAEAIELADRYRICDGHPLDESQRFTLRAALGERKDGSWAASTVCDFEPRQNGKNDTIAARELAGILLFKEKLIIHTAHEFATANEAFLRMAELFKSHDDLYDMTEHIYYANGAQSIHLRTGQRLVYKARTGGGGRGFAKADLVVYDEAQHLQGEHVAASGPARLANRNAQAWYSGSGGLATSSNAWRFRRLALAGDGDRLAYVEHTAEDVALDGDGRVVSSRPDVFDRDAWARANPAFGSRISDEALETALLELGPELFARECLCVWDAEPGDESVGVIPPVVWSRLVDAGSEIVSNRTFALDVAPDRHAASFGMAGRRADGLLHVETFDNRPGTRWVLDRGCEIAAHERTALWIDKSGPAASFIGLFAERGVDVVEVSVGEHAASCGQFIDAAVNEQLRHLGQPSLDTALKGAVLRRSGDVDLWARRAGRVDITPLVAVTLALGAVPRKATVEPWAVYR